MYKMLSLEATVYADSNDKYSSIFQISKTKKKPKQKLGLLSVLKYSVTYLQVFGVWYREVGEEGEGGLVVYLYSVKVSCPVTDSVCREVNVFSHVREFA